MLNKPVDIVHDGLLDHTICLTGGSVCIATAVAASGQAVGVTMFEDWPSVSRHVTALLLRDKEQHRAPAG